MKTTNTETRMNTEKIVVYAVDGVTVFAGILAYTTADGWTGIRTAGGRVDEVPAALTRPVGTVAGL